MSYPILTLPAPPLSDDIGPLPSSPRPPASVATHTRPIGITHPPPYVRVIVEKTATLVAKTGPNFEKRVLALNAGNSNFNFLLPSDPYHAYYQHRVSEIRSQQDTAPSTDPALAEDNDKDVTLPAVDPAAQFRIPLPRKVLHPPEAEQYTVRLPEGVTGEEIDIIKLTAQFVARNGKSFLSSLSGREHNNPQFYFMRPGHSMFMSFTELADAYSKVLMPPKGLTEKLRKGTEDLTTVLERCLHRLEWERSQEQAKQKEEDELEHERMQMALIDWHDFVVVATIDFVEEKLPRPLSLEEVIRRNKMKLSGEEEPMEVADLVKDDMEMDDEETQLVEEGMKAASARIGENGGGGRKNEGMPPPPTDEPEQPMRIVKNWRRPEDRVPAVRDPTKFVVSPITGELIPISEMAEHMRISLIDPKYKEQKERMMAKLRETTLAADDEITRNIVGLARTRPDIFGTTEEEVSNAVKAEIEMKDEPAKQVIWDGHSGSIGRTANQAMTQGDEQIDPLPPGMQLNMPRSAPGSVSYSVPLPVLQLRRPLMAPMPPQVRPIPPPMQQQQPLMMNQPPPMPQPISVNPPSMPVPPPPGFSSMGVPRSYVPISMPLAAPPPLPHGMPPPPPPEEAPPLPDEPEPKRQKIDDSSLIPEDRFLARHPGAVRVYVAVPNVDEGNLKGQVLEITIQSLSESVASLREKIAGEIQLPANKQKLSGRAGFLKDNRTLAYYNVGPGETLSLAIRERGGRKR